MALSFESVGGIMYTSGEGNKLTASRFSARSKKVLDNQKHLMYNKYIR
jgi:hypothetical protein